MKIFRWHGINAEGKKISGEISSLNNIEAKLILQNQKIYVIKIRQNRKRLKKISKQELFLFYRQLATLLKSCSSLTQCLDVLLKNQTPSTTMFYFLSLLKKDLESGKTLSTSLKKIPKLIDPLVTHLIYIGEETGALDIMFERINRYQENLSSLKHKLKQILLYPLIVLLISIIIFIFLMIFVVPRFENLFTTFHSELPYFTQSVINLSRFISSYIFYLLAFLSICLLVLKFFYIKYAKFKNLMDKLLYNIPIFGTLFQKYTLSRFSHILSVIIQSGVPLLDGLHMLIKLNSNESYKKVMKNLISGISSGLRLNIAMENQFLFPAMMIQMVRVGEESGTLELMLEKIGDFYEMEIDHWVKTLNTVLEPLIISILGVLIGGLIIAMYLPIFKLGTVI